MTVTNFLSLCTSFVIFISSTPLWSSPNLDDPLIATATIQPSNLSPGQGAQLKIDMSLPPGFHAYEDQFKISVIHPTDFKVSAPRLAPVITWFDKYSKKQRSGMKDKGTLTATVEAPLEFKKPETALELEVMYQACSDQFCLFPTPRRLKVPIQLSGFEQAETRTSLHAPSPEKGSPDLFSFEGFKERLEGGLLPALIFVFLAGIFTSFTPCIFPMIPITLAVLGHNSEKRSRAQNLLHSVIYVHGIATTYSILGLIAASTGGLFGASLGNPLVLSVICLIFLAMALSMYGLFEIQVPAFIRNSLGNRKNNSTLAGTYLTGLFAGIVASPCVGPILVAILTYVASTKDLFKGFILLFTYAMGMGLIFIVLGLSNQLVKKLPRSGPWLDGSKFVLGSLMLSAFYYYLSLLLEVRWFDLSLGLGLVTLASVYGAFLKPQGSALQSLRKGMMQAILFLGMIYISLGVLDLRPQLGMTLQQQSSLNQVEAVKWQDYSDQALQDAKNMGKPVLIDFWADWCAACHEMLEKTFPHPRVAALSESFVMLKYDATKDSEELRKLKSRYSIVGLPTFIFIDAKGQWLEALTLTQFEEPVAFSKRMERALQK